LSEEDKVLKEEVDFHEEWLKQKELTERIAYPLLLYHQIRSCQSAFNTANEILIETSVTTLLNTIPPEYIKSYPEIEEQIDKAKYYVKTNTKAKVPTGCRFSYAIQEVKVERIDYRQIFMSIMNLLFKLKMLPQFVRKQYIK